MNISEKRVLLLVILIWAVVFTLTFIWDDLNFSFFVKLIFDDAKEFAASWKITRDFMPIGYSGFLGSCIRFSGEGSVPACQTLIYAGIMISTFFFLKFGNVSGVLRILGILVVALYPLLVLNIWRIHDGNLTVFFLLGFLASGLSFSKFRNKSSIFVMGLFAGLLFTVRVNAILIVLPTLFLLGRGIYFQKKEYLKNASIFLISAFIFFVAVNLFVKQKPFFFPNHGFYNFFSATNEYAGKYLVRDYSGENSLGEALAARGFPVKTFDEWLNFSPDKYREFAISYIKTNPVEYLKLTGLKIITFFRPGYHVPEDFEWFSVDGLKRVSKIIFALPFFLWLFFVWKTRNNFFERENLFVFLVVALYALPFFIANADPRYRFPLDIIFVLDSFRRLRND